MPFLGEGGGGGIMYGNEKENQNSLKVCSELAFEKELIVVILKYV